MNYHVSHPLLALDFPGTAVCLWSVSLPGTDAVLALAPPVFEIDGQRVALSGPLLPVQEPIILAHGPAEHILEAPVVGQPGLTLRAMFRLADASPIVRFRYELHTAYPCCLSKTTGADTLSYFSASLAGDASVTEVQLSQFNEMVHSFCLAERPVSEGDAHG